MLTRLLNDLQHQITNDLFTYSIVIVDNDHARSAKSTFATFKEASLISINYYNEPEQNIALARNKAVENAQGNFIAFIDDDEFPTSTWLLSLYNAYNKFCPDGVLGPVEPHFDQKPPEWIIKGTFCERPSYNTGTVLNWLQTRTGNVLLKKDLFRDKSNYFQKEFGRTGGEDMAFFKKAIDQGKLFIWCNEAIVYETVPPKRWKTSFYIKGYIRHGGLMGEKVRKWPVRFYHLLKAILAFTIYSFTLPLSLLFGKHRFFRCLFQVIYYFSWLAGFFGLVIKRYRHD